MDESGKRKWGICVDFRKLNYVMVGDSFPLPYIEDNVSKLGRARYFSALDCAIGYWQVPPAEEDRVKTAFYTLKGHDEYLRMPFGLKSAPSNFQRLLNSVFMGLIGTRCFVYLGDVIIFGKPLQKHHEKLRKTDCFCKQNIKPGRAKLFHNREGISRYCVSL